jgi:hypothetical protein
MIGSNPLKIIINQQAELATELVEEAQRPDS